MTVLQDPLDLRDKQYETALAELILYSKSTQPPWYGQFLRVETDILVTESPFSTNRTLRIVQAPASNKKHFTFFDPLHYHPIRRDRISMITISLEGLLQPLSATSIDDNDMVIAVLHIRPKE